MSRLAPMYRTIRAATRALAAGLSPEDQMVQSCSEASPLKWHQAHTTWFFETFLLRPFLTDYQPFNEDFRWLFNSYYNTLGERIPDKPLRASLSRPTLSEVLAFRAYVDAAMETVLSGPVSAETTRILTLGLHHEQQHQELMLTDIKHAFHQSPLHPAYDAAPFGLQTGTTALELVWHKFASGLVEIGCSPNTSDASDFCFDNETPRHKVYVEPFLLANRAVTCREYLDFMADDAYSRPEFWLSEGWETINTQRWQAPLYWERDATNETGWRVFTLRGWHSLAELLDTPVCHLSYFEADAYARWRGCRLPTEAEWEAATDGIALQGNLLDSGRLHPGKPQGCGLEQLFGDCWEWTASAYSAYPGFHPLPGPLSEYNAKFMSSQMVLRGGSCATPPSHIRATYRNFFPPATRWQFSGIRLASSVSSSN